MTNQSIRPLRPVDLGTTESHEWDLMALARSLMAEEPFLECGRNAATLIHGPQMGVTVTVLRGGVALDEHEAGRPTQLLVLDGEIEWRDPNHSGPLLMRAGGSISFGREVRHSVSARRDSAFVLVFIAPPTKR